MSFLKSHLLVLFLTLGIAAPGCTLLQVPAIQGNGNAKSETRPIGEFTQVEMKNAMNLELTLGAAPSLEVTTDDNLLGLIKTEIVDGTLKIYCNDSYSSKVGVKIKASAKTITHLNASGACNATVTGIAEKQFASHLSGASRAKLQGSTEFLTLEGHGASSFDALRLDAKTVEAELSGASNGEVTVSQTLKATTSGASNLKYAGNPPNVEKKESGASKITPK